jgi:hypothetical protein
MSISNPVASFFHHWCFWAEDSPPLSYMFPLPEIDIVRSKPFLFASIAWAQLNRFLGSSAEVVVN